MFWDTLFLISGKEETLDGGTLLLHPRQIQYFLKTLIGQSKSLSLSPLTKSFKELIKTWVRHRWILGLGNEVRKEREGAGPPTTSAEHKRRRPCNSLTLLADVRVSKKDVFQVRYPSEAILRGSKGGRDKHLRTRNRFQPGG